MLIIKNVEHIGFIYEKKIWKHFRRKNFSTNTNNLGSEIQIAPKGYIVLDIS